MYIFMIMSDLFENNDFPRRTLIVIVYIELVSYLRGHMILM